MDIVDERLGRMETIKFMYRHRGMNQPDIAKEFGMKVIEVGEVLKAFDYHYGKLYTIEKVREKKERGEEIKYLINPCINIEDFAFLDKYTIPITKLETD